MVLRKNGQSAISRMFLKFKTAITTHFFFCKLLYFLCYRWQILTIYILTDYVVNCKKVKTLELCTLAL